MPDICVGNVPDAWNKRALEVNPVVHGIPEVIEQLQQKLEGKRRNTI